MSDALALLYRALHSPIGFLIRTNDLDRARQQLYAARAKSGDAKLKVLALRVAGPAFADEGNLLIVKAAKPK